MSNNVRKINVVHKAWFPSQEIVERRKRKGKLVKEAGPKTKIAARAVFDNVFLSLKEISSKSKISEGFLRVAFK